MIGGPPCQAFSRLRHLVEHNGYAAAENLIPEFERCLNEAQPRWWLMENVPGAPAPAWNNVDTQVIEDVWLGGETRRRRQFWYWGPGRFEIETLALHRPDPEPPVLASGGRPVPVGKIKRTAREIATRKGAAAAGFKTQAYYVKALADSGLPADFLASAPFTIAGKIKVVGNGVPPLMGRAVAKAVKRAVTPCA